jgi:hypothetical protein
MCECKRVRLKVTKHIVKSPYDVAATSHVLSRGAALGRGPPIRVRLAMIIGPCGAAANPLCMRLCVTVPLGTQGPLRCSGKPSSHEALWKHTPMSQRSPCDAAANPPCMRLCGTVHLGTQGRASTVQRCPHFANGSAVQRLCGNPLSKQHSETKS